MDSLQAVKPMLSGLAYRIAGRYGIDRSAAGQRIGWVDDRRAATLVLPGFALRADARQHKPDW